MSNCDENKGRVFQNLAEAICCASVKNVIKKYGAFPKGLDLPVPLGADDIMTLYREII